MAQGKLWTVSATGVQTGDFIWGTEGIPLKQAYKKLAAILVSVKLVKGQIES